jgi:hypothetical protein
MSCHLALNPDSSKALVCALLGVCPFGTRVVFLNCEFQESEGGMAWSDDLFAVVKLPLLSPKRVQLEPSADWQLNLMATGRELIQGTAQRHATLDLIIKPDGSNTSYVSAGPLRRLAGGDRSFRSKHLEYVAVEPLLGLVK